MQLSFPLATALAILQVASAKIVYVTQIHTTTVVGDGYVQSSTSAPAETPTTVEPTSTVAASTTSVAAAASSSSSSESGIYADIAESPDLDATFAKDILDAHNTDRSKHQAPNLSWDKTVYEYAQAYADKYDCSGSLTHSGGQYGENLACGYSDGPAAVAAWYSEGDNWDYSNANSYNHFTQVIWKSTTKLGCAIKDCSANNWGHYVICSYDTAGNIIGELAANVLSG
ncbi:protein Pry1p [[Candida] railenensis]|uniref:Protein Pry1p n=1 Tax=[Candida] railenensis TaxID=45579 RepID=A0A9P0QTD6_9ASCO|nr:protein Pry1p [[Candida] railenensis]